VNFNGWPRTATSIHWHGIILPAAMDGVPGLGLRGIGLGETLTGPGTGDARQNSQITPRFGRIGR
jgi:FtsP/CotA-like multicopper oxidase with cupredoxin domain